ncbi:tetratricopeptide repeat protein [Algoriphagus aquatilis]|uniref:Tetratricopeptide repeat protein n=1 Tax=Algoriphagus aquatilis TaxID=490186 RepID=A0ABW0BWN8_9BACT
MRITYPRNQFLSQLFPAIDITNDEQLIHAFRKYLTLGEYSPKVELTDSEVVIEVPSDLLLGNSNKYNRATDLCNKGKFAEAKPILVSLIEEFPLMSEYHRTLAQVYEEEGDHEQAIDILIEALRCDPKNHWALILMGNIYSRYKNDTDTAMTFFDQVIHADPTNYIALNNIGGALLQTGKIDLGEKYLLKAYQIKPNYPNITYALGIVAEMKGDNQKAFDYSFQTLKCSESGNNPVYQNALRTALEAAKKISDSNSGKEELIDFIQELEEKTGKEIRMEEDETIPTVAKVEIAENHKRDYHLIKYKKSSAVDHLILHELIHILFYHEARQINENKLFTSKNGKLAEFKKEYTKEINGLIKKGYSGETISKLFEQLFHGILQQVFNAPIDLFIEDLIFHRFPTLRPQQFLSLYKMGIEAYEAVSNPKAVDLIPSEIVSQSKVYNVLGAKHTDDLMGTRLEEKYKVSFKEKELVNSFWEEFLEYRQDRQAGEEYELVQHWGEDLGLASMFELVEETVTPKKSAASINPEDLISSIENDPGSLADYSAQEEKEMNAFKAAHSNKDLNLAVSYHMLNALEYFNDLSKVKVKEIAFEIALLAQTGIDPKKQGYRLNKIPNKKFSGYNLLAYYYVSWAIAVPEMLSELQMPFEKEYELAKSIFNLGK